jgi:cysteine synthase A
VLDTSIIDEIVQVENEDAFATARKLAKEEGILIGMSAGAAAFAAVSLGNRQENAGKTIVTIFPDSGERYLAGTLFEE